MKNKKPFINRELSWLAFNNRILDLASDDGLPVLERLKFLAIAGSNLDEFNMVRVGGLQLLVGHDVTGKDLSGLTPQEQLRLIDDEVQRMTVRQYAIYREKCEPVLIEAGVRRILPEEITSRQKKFLENYFNEEIYPVFTPISLVPGRLPPLLTNRLLHCAVSIVSREKEGKKTCAVIPIGKNTPRCCILPPERSKIEFMLVEDIVALFGDRFFAGAPLIACIPFRIIRNADMSVREDMTFDLLAEMETVLVERKRSGIVCMEIGNAVSEALLSTLKAAFNAGNGFIHKMPGPPDLSFLGKFSDIVDNPSLVYTPWTPTMSTHVQPGQTMFEAIARKDFIVCHPYERFDPVIKLIEDAAADPSVTAIKQLLYRTSRNSPIIAALIRAAEAGKYVTALVELKARFDEERNIEWARELEDAGVQVLYGVQNLKTHAKVCLVVRREATRIARYMHFGTGNYNETTAQLYSDISYFTDDYDIGCDVTSFFNVITGQTQPVAFRKLAMAPDGLRETIIGLIDGETARKREGQPSFIRAKMNSLADPQIIAALYRASQAGVEISLNVRGICCLTPGVKGYSEHIRVRSIIDRYLEHSRILHVAHGGSGRVFISTADWMPRNCDRRIELLVPVEEPAAKKQCIAILDACFADTVNAWVLDSRGKWMRIHAKGPKAMRCQEILYTDLCQRNKTAAQSRKTEFRPYRSPTKKTA